MKSQTVLAVLLPVLVSAQNITIDGQFEDWNTVVTSVIDSSNDEHDTDWFGDGKLMPEPRKYSDIDILEVKFAHDRENLYGYVRAKGVVGRTSRAADGKKAGRYYFIITIDVDNRDDTGYPVQEGNYWPNSTGYDMNMEVEFYDGSFNTGHYIHHDFMTENDLNQGRADLANRIIRLGPGTYEHYLQWVTFPDTTIVYVTDKGPVISGGIIEVAVSEDGHEAEMKAPMWGFFWDENGVPIIELGDTLDISVSLEGSGELSETAVELGYTGSNSVWGSDTAYPIEGYVLTDPGTGVAVPETAGPAACRLLQNYPNPFNSSTTFQYSVSKSGIHFSIVDIRGRTVRLLRQGIEEKGEHFVTWDACDDLGRPVPGGIYLAVLRSGGQVHVNRVVLLK